MSKHEEPAGESLTPDRAFDLLRNDRRRRALRALREANEAMALGELAAETVARDEGVAPGAVSADRRERIAASLHHCHLPKLEDASVVEYDSVADRVDATETVEELQPYFELAEAEGGTGLRSD